MPLRRDAKVELLKKVPLFAGCSKSELRELAKTADELDIREGTVLTREGRTGKEFFVLVDGTAQVTKGDKKVAELKAGDWFGEIALLTDSPRTATVTATSPVDVLVITDRRFRTVVETMPSIALKVLSCVGERLARDAHSEIRASLQAGRRAMRTPMPASTITTAPTAMTTSPTENTFASGIHSSAAQRSTSHDKFGSLIAVELA